jgi:multiple sugar transport system substrate-binding protein
VDFLASQDWQTTLTAEFSRMSPFKATYDQPKVKKAIPFATDIRQAIEQARARPVSPVYPQISQASTATSTTRSRVARRPSRR